MGLSPRRWRALAIFTTVVICLGYQLITSQSRLPLNIHPDGLLHWEKLPERHPVKSLTVLPTGAPVAIPKIQAAPPVLTKEQDRVRKERLAAVKASFVHSWHGYKAHAWLRDEVIPVSGGSRDTFGGWAATLVDALDTLWIIGMKEDFEQAVKALDQLDFSYTPEEHINVFETTIRYLGGFLAAYDVSGQKYEKLLEKAVEVADFLLCAFDTPNRMPIARWPWRDYMVGNKQTASSQVLVSEIGSLSLEFTRLSQITGDPKYYDAVQRISDVMEKGQMKTKLPGMWPVVVDALTPSFGDDNTFTLGGMSDSAYEYLPKQYMLLGGLLEQPRRMYEKFIEVAKKEIFFRVFNPKNDALLMSGDARAFGGAKEKITTSLLARSQHLTCFTGGMVGIGSKIFNRPEDLETARQLTNGCVWAYSSTATGIMPEVFDVISCNNTMLPSCEWYEGIWHKRIPGFPKSDDPEGQERYLTNYGLQPGIIQISDGRYILRPEAIESVFMMWRITGEVEWMDKAWRMFQAIERATRTEIGNSAIKDVTEAVPEKLDQMESFWLAETLKYFWLVFADFGEVSLDEYVLNTEAHPFKRNDVHKAKAVAG